MNKHPVLVQRMKDQGYYRAHELAMDLETAAGAANIPADPNSSQSVTSAQDAAAPLPAAPSFGAEENVSMNEPPHTQEEEYAQNGQSQSQPQL